MAYFLPDSLSSGPRADTLERPTDSERIRRPLGKMSRSIDGVGCFPDPLLSIPPLLLANNNYNMWMINI